MVSPNVRTNNRTVAAWKQATLTFKAAFMGYRPKDRGHMAIGYKFAEEIKPGDIVLVARRHHKKPDIVGFGVVKGKFKRRLQGFKPPEKEWHGSLRLLIPFTATATTSDEISKTSMMKVLAHTVALCKLHPKRNRYHRIVCDWMERTIGVSAKRTGQQVSGQRLERVQLVGHSHEGELEYQVRTKASTTRAIKKEEKLVREYCKWLTARHRKLQIMSDGHLRCDVYEADRNNLIEAKASSKREYIRMAVEQLLDYAYLGRSLFGRPHMAILLSSKPDLKSLKWLPKQIRIVWKEGKRFGDNANKAFV